MIGALADDFTGASDIAVAFRRAGLRVVIVFATDSTDPAPAADVVVVGLKTRTIPAEQAVARSLEALAWLRERGAEQILFKYCSTFDSRDSGNIGPVADALAAALGARRAVVVPASPEHRRTQYMGHLFVDRDPLAESPMRHHPLTPMTDSSIPRILARQTDRPVALIDHRTVREGAGRIAEAFAEAEAAGGAHLVVDALEDGDLRAIGEAVAEDVLVTGAAGLAAGLGVARARRLGRTGGTAADEDPVGPVPQAAIAGSCSARTLEQVAHMQRTHPHHHLDALALPDAADLAAAALAWYDALPAGSSPLFSSSLPPAPLRRVQEALGADRASRILEDAAGRIAVGLLERGVRRLVVAGGETSGAVVTALGVRSGMIGAEVAAGVPWIHARRPRSDEDIALLLKSGNFGGPPLLTRALTGDPA